MTTTAIREKLHHYIDGADDKKIKAIYTILAEDIATESDWWKDAAFVKELDVRYEALTNGTDKGMTLSDVDSEIESRRKKRAGK
ncbi:MAG: hypothetical protein JWO03_2010 [Bacteroidetes bacterium]|nr:hypothetical protein [Bacteroidota bacterium]